MVLKDSENKPTSEGSNRLKIQDIVPRTNRRDSLLTKIMGSQARTPAKELRSSFLRSLPFGRGGAVPHEKVIRLKKRVLPETEFVRTETLPPEEPKPQPASRKGVSKKSVLLEEARKRAVLSGAVRDVPRVLPRFSRRRMVFLGGGGVAVLFVLFSFVFMRATVSLALAPTTLSLEGIRIEVAARTAEITVAEKKIPGFLQETVKSLEREFSATATERVSRKAAGTIYIYNAFNTAPQTLIATTRLQDLSGKIFRLKQRVVVPGAKMQNGVLVPSSVLASVEADKAGAEYNIGPGRFTIPGFAGTPKSGKFYAESSDAFAGGFSGEALVVKQADIDAASEEVTAALFAELKDELERSIPADATVVPGAREIVITGLRKPRVGEARDRFTVGADGKAAAMLFRTADLFALLEQLALAPDAEKKISREQSRLVFDRASVSVKDKILSFDVGGSLTAFSVVTPEEIQKSAGGKKRADVENILRADSRVRAFAVKLFPFWRNTIPADKGKIRVLITE